MDDLAGASIGTERLVLRPLRVADAEEMVEVLGDPALHEYIGGRPLGPEELRRRFAAMVAGPGRPGELWRSWVVRRRAGSAAVGTMQATLTRHAEGWKAEVAWVVGVPWQGRGYAAEAARALVGWLLEAGVGELVAHVHPDHVASARVAAAAGLVVTADLVDGERVWHHPGTGR